MKHRERVWAALNGRVPDRCPMSDQLHARVCRAPAGGPGAQRDAPRETGPIAMRLTNMWRRTTRTAGATRTSSRWPSTRTCSRRRWGGRTRTTRPSTTMWTSGALAFTTCPYETPLRDGAIHRDHRPSAGRQGRALAVPRARPEPARALRGGRAGDPDAEGRVLDRRRHGHYDLRVRLGAARV